MGVLFCLQESETNHFLFFCIERESKNVNILQQLKHEKQHIFENVIY